MLSSQTTLSRKVNFVYSFKIRVLDIFNQPSFKDWGCFFRKILFTTMSASTLFLFFTILWGGVGSTSWVETTSTILYLMMICYSNWVMGRLWLIQVILLMSIIRWLSLWVIINPIQRILDSFSLKHIVLLLIEIILIISINTSRILKIST